MKVEVAVLGSPSLGSRTVSVDGKAALNSELVLGEDVHIPASSTLLHTKVGWLKCCFTSTETVGLLGT